MPINYQGSGGGVPRKTAKIFGKNAASIDMTVFGSTLGGNTVYSSDLDSIQSSAYETGWRNAVISNLNYPLLSDMNAVQHTLSQQIAYTLQHGIPEYDSGTTYYAFDKVQYNDIIYTALQDNFYNITPTNTTYWAVYYQPDMFANLSLSNLNSTGEKHFLNKNQISNCILEAPNGYLTYSGNALTLKQGLKFFVPRGRLSDGRLNNYECVLSGDVTGYAPPWNGVTTRYEIFVDINANVVMTWSQEAYYIDEDAPILTSGQTAIWYNLVDNYFAYFDLATNQWVTVDYAHIGSYEVLPNTDTINLVRPRYPMRVLSNADQNLIAQCAFPSEDSTFLTLGASGTKYKALSAGWFAFDVVGGAVGEYALLKVYHQGATLPIYTLQQSVFAAGAHASWLVPVNHGDILEATYTLTGGVYYFGFIYAEGEV